MVLVHAMFGSNLDNTLILMIIIGVIIGGVAAAFFAAGTKGKKEQSKHPMMVLAQEAVNSVPTVAPKLGTHKSSAQTAELKFNFFY